MRITKREWERLGGLKNSNLYRRQTKHGWRYYKTASNPKKVKLPSTWTPTEVRVNSRGQVQLKINPGSFGKGKFARCVAAVEAKGGAYDPGAVCAAAERRTLRRSNGYIVYPGRTYVGSKVYTSLKKAHAAAKRVSKREGLARIKSADTGRVVAQYKGDKEITRR